MAINKGVVLAVGVTVVAVATGALFGRIIFDAVRDIANAVDSAFDDLHL